MQWCPGPISSALVLGAMNAELEVILFPARQRVTPTRPMSLCSLLSGICSPLLCISHCLRVWRCPLEIGYLLLKLALALLAWVPVTCISLAESPNCIPSSIFISHTEGSFLVSEGKRWLLSNLWQALTPNKKWLHLVIHMTLLSLKL